MSDHKHFISGLAGVLVGALLVGGPSAIAAIGNAVIIGDVNTGDAKTTISGSVSGPLVKIENNQPDDGTALVLESAGPNLKVSNAKKIKKLNADKVDGYSAGQLIRSAHAETLNAADANGAAVTVTIDAPVDGTLIAGGTIAASWASAYDFYTCQIDVDLLPIDGTIMNSVVDWGGATHTDNKEEDCSTTGGVDVAAGSHTVSLTVGGRNTATLYGATIWAIFVPFDGSGTQVIVP